MNVELITKQTCSPIYLRVLHQFYQANNIKVHIAYAVRRSEDMPSDLRCTISALAFRFSHYHYTMETINMRVCIIMNMM